MSHADVPSHAPDGPYSPDPYREGPASDGSAPDGVPPMETWCSVAVFRQGAVLLMRGQEDGVTVWKLPGGHVHPNEGLGACARRELLEETGLRAEEMHCAFVLDVHDRDTGRYRVEIVLFPTGEVTGEITAREAGHEPRFVSMDELDELPLRPPMQSHLRGLRALHLRELGEDAGAGAAVYALPT